MEIEPAANMAKDDIRPVEPSLNYEEFVRKLGSPYYEEQFIAAVENMGNRESTKFLMTNRHNKLLGPTVGKLFESLLIKAMKTRPVGGLNGYMLHEEGEGSSVSVRMHKITKERVFSDENFNEIFSMDMLSRKDSIFRPSSPTHATYDFYVMADVKIGNNDSSPALLGVQVTKASSHTVAFTGLDRLAKLGARLGIPVYTAFFVEQSAASEYQKAQTVTRNANQKGVHAPTIEQFVVPINSADWFVFKRTSCTLPSRRKFLEVKKQQCRCPREMIMMR
jgi:hypothetical protein